MEAIDLNYVYQEKAYHAIIIVTRRRIVRMTDRRLDSTCSLSWLAVNSVVISLNGGLLNRTEDNLGLRPGPNLDLQ